MPRFYSHMQRMNVPVRQKPGAHPSPFTIVVLLLLSASVLLVGVGIAALLLGPFAILAGASLFIFTLSLICLVGIIKASRTLARGLVRWLSHRRAISTLLPAVFLLRLILARMVANWLMNWLARHDPASHPPGASGNRSYQTHVFPQVKGA